MTDTTDPEAGLLDDLIERWHVWKSTADDDLKVMLGLRLMQDAFHALPNLAATPTASPTAGGLDEAYRERNAVVAALIRVGGYPAQVVMAPDTEGWFIVYAETPQGQVSWHISPDDMDLFSDWPVAFGTHHSPWDGHTTDEKYQRVAALQSEATATGERKTP